MKKELTVIFIALLLPIIKGQCSNIEKSPNSFLFGSTDGIGQHNSFSGNIYAGYSFRLNSRMCETSFGYNYFKNKTSFDNVKDLFYLSHGLFGEFNYFFAPKIYYGIGLSINTNVVDKESQSRYIQNSTKKPPEIFPGKAYWGQIGFNQKIHEKINLRIQSQIGLHNYQIETGAVYLSNNHSPIPVQFQDKYAKELKIRLIYNFRIGANIYF